MSQPPAIALPDAIRGVSARIRRARALRGASVGLAVGALAATATGALPWIGLGALGLGVGYGWAVDARDAVARLDAAAGLDGALRCAWDHRDDDRPMSRAQQSQALGALEARRAATDGPAVDVAAAPAPAAGWLLGPALWVLPALMVSTAPPSVVEPRSASGDASIAAAVDPKAPKATEPAGDPAVSPTEAPEERDPRATSSDGPDVSVDAGVAADAGAGAAGDGGAGGVSPQGVAGRAVGEQGGGPAGAETVPVRAGAGADLVLPTAAGDRAPGTGPAGRLVVGRTPPPPDAIADPARPYPSRYRRAIAAWFDRSRP